MKAYLRVLISGLIIFVLVFSMPGMARASTSSLLLYGGGSAPDGLAAGQETYQVFFDENFTFAYDGGSVCISSEAGSCKAFAIDDEAIITINGIPLYFPSLTRDMEPMDISFLLHYGENQINVRLIDRVGPGMGGSMLWLAAGQAECARIDFEPLSYEHRSPPVVGYWTIQQLIYRYALSGNTCPDVPIYPTLGQDPSFTIESAYGTVEVNLKGEIETGPNLEKNPMAIPFSAEVNSLQPPTFTVYRLFEYESSAPDFSLKSEQKFGNRVTLRPPAYTLTYVVSIAVAYRQQIVQFGVQVRPLIQPAIQQMMIFAPALLLLKSPQTPSYVLAASKPLPSQLPQMSVRQEITPPSSDVVHDLDSFFGSEFISVAKINQLDIQGQSVKAPGQNIHYNSGGFIPNSRVYLALIRMGDAAPTIETETIANADGAIRGVLRLPVDAEPGRWLTVAVDSQLLYKQLKAIGEGQEQDLTPYLSAQTTIVPDYTAVKIDIKPNDANNPVNLGSQGVVPVAILGATGFDAQVVAPLTVQFGPDAAPEFHQRGHVEDVNKDGLPDMLLHIETRQTGILSTDSDACLFGQTTNGTYIFGCDKVRIVPNKR